MAIAPARHNKAMPIVAGLRNEPKRLDDERFAPPCSAEADSYQSPVCALALFREEVVSMIIPRYRALFHAHMVSGETRRNPTIEDDRSLTFFTVREPRHHQIPSGYLAGIQQESIMHPAIMQQKSSK